MSYRRRLDSRRPPGRSPCSPVSKGAGGWWRGRRSSPEVRSRRRRSSGECGVDAMVHGRRGWWALRAPGSSLSTAVCSDSSCGGSSHAGDEARRRRASGTAALALGSMRSDGKKGRTAEELTAVPQGWSVGSGRGRSSRGGDGDLRRREVEDDGVEMLGASGVAQLDEEE